MTGDVDVRSKAGGEEGRRRQPVQRREDQDRQARFQDPFTDDVINAAIEVHRTIGPGLLESLYERCLEREPTLRGYTVARQQSVTVSYKGLVFDQELRFDLLVNGVLLLELKCIAAIQGVHQAQALSYMRLLDVPKGLILNFHHPRLTDDIVRLELPSRS